MHFAVETSCAKSYTEVFAIGNFGMRPVVDFYIPILGYAAGLLSMSLKPTFVTLHERSVIHSRVEKVDDVQAMSIKSNFDDALQNKPPHVPLQCRHLPKNKLCSLSSAEPIFFMRTLRHSAFRLFSAADAPSSSLVCE